MWGHSEKVARKRAFTENRICQYLDLGLHSFQNYAKQMSVVYKHPSLWYSVTTVRAKTSRSKEPVTEFMRIQTVLSPHTGKVGRASPRGTWAAQRVALYPSLGEDSPATLTEQCLMGLHCARSGDPGRSLRRLEERASRHQAGLQHPHHLLP